MKKYITGSNYFFGGLPGFQPHDIDYMVIEDEPEYKHMMNIRGGGIDEFRFRKKPIDEFIDYTLSYGPPMAICRFLVKEYCEDYNVTIEHLKRLKPLVDRMDEKHLYLKYIWERYIDHGDFILTDSERLQAYEIYKSSRVKNNL